MKLITLVPLLFISLRSICQEIDWSKSKNWKIYAANSNNAFSYPLDSFKKYNSANMNDTLTASIWSKSAIWPKSKYAYWMGMYYGSYELPGGAPRKVVFSAYGGFLFDCNTRRYYELPLETRKRWNEFMNINLEKVFEQ